MGTKNLYNLKTQFDSINSGFIDEFFYKKMLWLLGSLWVFLCNHVLYSFGLILNYISRIQVGVGKNKPPFKDQTESDQFQDFEIDGFREELANFLFKSFEDGEKGQEETECSAIMETVCVHEGSRNSGGNSESSALMETQTDINKDHRKREAETESSVFMEVHSDSHEDKEKGGETESSVAMGIHSYFYEDKEKRRESESCNFMGTDCDVHEDGKKRDEEETEVAVLIEADTATTTSKYQYVSGTNISAFIEEPTAMNFTFQEFYVGPNVSVISDDAFSSTEIIAQKEESLVLPPKCPVDKKEDVASDSVSESSSNRNKIDDSMTYEFLGSNDSRVGFESESLKAVEGEKTEDSCDRKFLGIRDEGKDEKKGSNQEEGASYGEWMAKSEEARWKEVLSELGYDEQNEEEFEREHDHIVEQLKMELRNARQGGLPTILEEEEEQGEEEAEETESPDVVEDKKLQKIEEQLEYMDQMDEIDEVYQSYEEKMRKLDILNYQTMHGLGLLQLKDPLKSTFFPSAKPIISQNLWPRKAAKNSRDPLLTKFVQELQRDLELVYVGQVCLSWEILCWQLRKAQELKQHDAREGFPHYNLAAGEFQLFQVLMQRFIENEPFQGPRTQNFVKNRCVIRNLLQVPAIRDDSVKEKKVVKEDEENAVAIARLAEIIKESMRVFWEFVKADKDDGNLILKFSQQTRIDLKDPSISDLLKDIRTQLQKKEKKLKDMVRSGNCIVRKFQKQQQRHEDQLNHEQLLAQVELKLVSRVLNLSKLRKDHLIWCYEKLNNIKFVKKKLLVEPSFLLFPC